MPSSRSSLSDVQRAFAYFLLDASTRRSFRTDTSLNLRRFKIDKTRRYQLINTDNKKVELFEKHASEKRLRNLLNYIPRTSFLMKKYIARSFVEFRHEAPLP